MYCRLRIAGQGGINVDQIRSGNSFNQSANPQIVKDRVDQVTVRRRKFDDKFDQGEPAEWGLIKMRGKKYDANFALFWTSWEIETRMRTGYLPTNPPG